MKKRDLRKGFLNKVSILAAIILSLFHLYTAGFGILTSMQQKTFHLGFILFLVFLLIPATSKAPKDRVPWYDVIFAILALSSNFYIFFMYETVCENYAAPISEFNFLVGIIALLLLLEGARRTVGIELTILSVFSIFYMYFGSLFPGFLKFKGVSIHRIIEIMAWTPEGPYGLVLEVSATVIYLFVLFGSFLSKTGIGSLFNDLALGLCGQARGGGAKVSVVTSCLMGMVSGSAVSNVLTTGSFTIPLMRKVGYKPSFAAAVEAVSSTGGQIMPPIMGAAAFIIASILGIPYFMVIKAAFIPALFYFIAVWIAIDLRAAARNLKGLEKEEIPSYKKTFREKGLLLIPILTLVVLIVQGFSTLFCVFYSIVATIIISSINKKTRMSLRDFISTLIEGAENSLSIATACGVVGFTVAMIGATGIGMTLGMGIIGIAGGNKFFCLILIAISSIILGTGLPPTACYVVVAVVSAPILVNFMGIQPLVAHFFVFYYGILAVITPPVALASFTAAGLVGESYYKVGWEAFKIGVPAYVLPFIFIVSPALLLIDFTILGLVVGLLKCTIVALAMGVATQGYFIDKVGYIPRILLVISSILIMYTEPWSDFIGILISLIVFLVHYLIVKKKSFFQKVMI